jgi:hypothetical protein
MDILLVFYGYLSLAFGWGFYAVVFISFGVALFSHLKEGNIYQTAERFINSMVTLGVLNLSVATLFALVATARWLLGS